MVKGTLKGNSAMSQAIKELITGEASAEPTTSSPEASPGERGSHTVASFRAHDEGW